MRCPRCTEGPKGIQGHDGLQLLAQPREQAFSARFLLECTECGTRWERVFVALGPQWRAVVPA